MIFLILKYTLNEKQRCGGTGGCGDVWSRLVPDLSAFDNKACLERTAGK